MERAENRTAKTKAARELREDDLARIAEILNNGVSQRKSAEAMGVSQSFVQRRVNSSPNEPVSCLLGEC
jgi:DNA invertase Pin-like site-specific DNA recombinase